MNKTGLLTAIILLIAEITGYGAGINKSREAVRAAFMEIRTVPTAIQYSNSLEVNNSGGHLQGIQLIERKSGRYAVMTGSSDQYSYYAVIRLGVKNTVLSVNKLMDKPLKHAGGFQVYRDYMAVGIEDNSGKDRSLVCIYDISDPEKPKTEPLAVIRRSGEPMRSTAGCVGITKYGNKILVAVGDWDTKHIDLYATPTGPPLGGFEKIYSFEMEKQSRENWLDSTWSSYQNINLFTFDGNELYLAGSGQNRKNENIADLFALEEESSGKFMLTKIASRIFNCTKETSFKAAAGFMYEENAGWSVVAAGYNIGESSFLDFFESRKNKP